LVKKRRRRLRSTTEEVLEEINCIADIHAAVIVRVDGILAIGGEPGEEHKKDANGIRNVKLPIAVGLAANEAPRLGRPALIGSRIFDGPNVHKGQGPIPVLGTLDMSARALPSESAAGILRVEGADDLAREAASMAASKREAGSHPESGWRIHNIHQGRRGWGDIPSPRPAAWNQAILTSADDRGRYHTSSA